MQEAADREKAEAALRETERQRDAAEEQKRARDVEEREAQHKQEIAEREKAERATQEAQRKREAAAEQERARDKERAREKDRREAGPKQRYSLHGEVSNRVGRRSACQQQAEEKGLSGVRLGVTRAYAFPDCPYRICCAGETRSLRRRAREGLVRARTSHRRDYLRRCGSARPREMRSRHEQSQLRLDVRSCGHDPRSVRGLASPAACDQPERGTVGGRQSELDQSGREGVGHPQSELDQSSRGRIRDSATGPDPNSPFGRLCAQRIAASGINRRARSCGA